MKTIFKYEKKRTILISVLCILLVLDWFRLKQNKYFCFLLHILSFVKMKTITTEYLNKRQRKEENKRCDNLERSFSGKKTKEKYSYLTVRERERKKQFSNWQLLNDMFVSLPILLPSIYKYLSLHHRYY